MGSCRECTSEALAKAKVVNSHKDSCQESPQRIPCDILGDHPLTV